MEVTMAALLGVQCYISNWQRDLAVGLMQAQEMQEQWKLVLRFQKAMKKAMCGRVRFPIRLGVAIVWSCAGESYTALETPGCRRCQGWEMSTKESCRYRVGLAGVGWVACGLV